MLSGTRKEISFQREIASCHHRMLAQKSSSNIMGFRCCEACPLVAKHLLRKSQPAEMTFAAYNSFPHRTARSCSILKISTRWPGYFSRVFRISSMMVFEVGRVSCQFLPLYQWASLKALMPRSSWVQSTTVRLVSKCFLSTVLSGLQKTWNGSSDSAKGPTKEPNLDSVLMYFCTWASKRDAPWRFHWAFFGLGSKTKETSQPKRRA